jgi:hypothetical protein
MLSATTARRRRHPPCRLHPPPHKARPPPCSGCASPGREAGARPGVLVRLTQVLTQVAEQVLIQRRTNELHALHAASNSMIRPSSKVTLRTKNTCCKNMFRVFQMFHMDVTGVSCGCCKSRSGCCNGCTCMLQTFVPNVSVVF